MPTDLEVIAQRNVRAFTLFRMFFSARFYYPVYALIFLDYGLTLEQFGILNGIWAVTIVLSEVPSGALADTVGRRNLLILSGVFMLLEMAVLLIAPINGGTLLFMMFLFNRIISGLAEAAASGADEALAYDSLKAVGQEDRWGHILERVQRDTSIVVFFVVLIGAAIYDPNMVNALFAFLGLDWRVVQEDLVKVPLFLTFCSGIVVLTMALRMRECTERVHDSVVETLKSSWRQSVTAAKWIWTAALPFGILMAVMSLDSVIRQFLTLASEYWNVIDMPIASYGLIGSGMAVVGMFVPRWARLLAERYTPVQNYMFTATMVFVGLLGLGFAIPYWGIAPAVFLYSAMHFMAFFASRYLNESAPSDQRATVLSFKGLTSNFAYGAVSLMYSGLIVAIKAGDDTDALIVEADYQKSVFIDSLQVFPWYFLVTVVLVFAVHRLKFGKGS